jgi:hypothetical protein
MPRYFVLDSVSSKFVFKEWVVIVPSPEKKVWRVIGSLFPLTPKKETLS